MTITTAPTPAAVSRRLVVLDPTVEPAPEVGTRVPRPSSLAGLTVGLLDNSKANSDRFLELLGEALRERHGVAATVMRRKPSASLVVTPELAAELAGRVDAVVPAVGD